MALGGDYNTCAMTYDIAIIGGGIVGLATARALLEKTPSLKLVLCEKESELGRHQTGHNSGVIHSGIYYEPGSLKDRLCREGARRTEEYAAVNAVPVRITGKHLVATDERELARMHALRERAEVNGIEAEVIDGAELRRREPEVAGLGALWLPGTGITDYGAIARALAEDVRRAGGEVRTGCEVRAVEEAADEVRLATSTGTVRAGHVVCCAGLQADRLARMAGVAIDVAIVPFRGEYYEVVPGRADLVTSLIYPIPDPALPFLGVHLTPRVDGGLDVGPNAMLGLAREGSTASARRSRSTACRAAAARGSSTSRPPAATDPWWA
jgi:L-2-hydroxyglutarate oxidase